MFLTNVRNFFYCLLPEGLRNKRDRGFLLDRTNPRKEIISIEILSENSNVSTTPLIK
jgi:hypothetical protein